MKAIDLVGKQFGRLVVVEKLEKHGRHWQWRCECSCGGVKIAGGSNLVDGHTQSCGCLRSEMSSLRLKSFERANKLAAGVGSCNFLWNNYKQGAKKRGLDFEVSKEMFMSLTSSDCHYCGSEPAGIVKGHRSNGEYVFNGIDRQDSSLGYVEGNMLPCCSICNYAKNDLLYEDFQKWIGRLVKFKLQEAA